MSYQYYIGRTLIVLKINNKKSFWFGDRKYRIQKVKVQGLHVACLLSTSTVRGVMIVYGGTGSPFGLTTSNNVVACNLESGNFHR
jgi:hypothetical protein